MLRPIAVPMVASGFDLLGDRADVGGVHRRPGSFPSRAPRRKRPWPRRTAPAADTLAPGDAVGVALLTGDFELGATGTVTHVDGDRVYAFGHPLYNLGPTEFPMTKAEVQVVLPSLMSSSKLASFGEVVGTVQQDRATAIAGRLGAGPSLIPVSITLNSDRGPSPLVQLRRRPRLHVHAAPDLPGGGQRADVVRARRRSRVVRRSAARPAFARRTPSRSKTSSPAISRPAAPRPTSPAR